MANIRDYIVKNIKIVIPVVVVVVVAILVPIVLRSTNARAEGDGGDGEQGEVVQESPSPEPVEEQDEDIPLVANDRPEIYTLVATYYNAMGLGDCETLVSVFDELSENDLLRYEKTSEYLDHYPVLDLYTKPGAEEGTLLVYVYYKLVFKNHEEEVPGYQTLYVCEDGNGGLYIKNEKNFTEEEAEYIKRVNAQDDVVVFNNRVNLEYNDLMEERPELYKYIVELTRQVNASIGVALAEQNTEDEGDPQEDVSQEENPGEGTQGTEGEIADQPAQEIIVQYVKATTTVNVRSSDSEEADRLGKVTEGTRLQVQEVLSNGWTKVLYEGKDGYIKSDYLKMEDVSGLAVIGSVTAKQNINIRAEASEDAERLGVLPGGDSLELYAVEDGWCKVNYNGRVAYVKADYVTQ